VIFEESQFGTSLTLFKISYIIHVLARLQSIHSHPQALIIVPTVELAFTVGSGIEKISVYLPDIQITYATSSLLLTQKSFNTAIVIGTIDAFDSFQSLIDFSQLEMLIIDEIDTMVIREDYRHILLNLMDHLPLINHCQLLVYSSTLSEQIMNFTNELIPNSILIKQRSDKQQLSNIEQFYVMCQDENKKIDVIMIILQQFIDSQIMIFCADDETTERIYNNILIENKNNARILTTNSNNQERISLIEEFRSNLFRIFVLSAQTSATTHGVDLDNVNIVINYNLPCSLGINSDLDYVTYHQRLDRCGRYDKHGYLVRKI
jgi:superfamily II DNA/RNA helicase